MNKSLGSTYPGDHEKVGTGHTSCYPPRDLENVNLKRGRKETTYPVAPCLRQWTAYACVPLDQTALHRPVATLEVSCYWFPQPLVGSTYPRDHVKVARGLSILCPTPGWDEPRRRYVSERDGGEGLTSSGGQDDSEVRVDRQK